MSSWSLLTVCCKYEQRLQPRKLFLHLSWIGLRRVMFYQHHWSIGVLKRFSHYLFDVLHATGNFICRVNETLSRAHFHVVWMLFSVFNVYRPVHPFVVRQQCYCKPSNVKTSTPSLTRVSAIRRCETVQPHPKCIELPFSLSSIVRFALESPYIGNGCVILLHRTKLSARSHRLHRTFVHMSWIWVSEIQLLFDP